MRRRFQIGMGVNPSLIINKGIYIQHVDGGLYTKENWSNKGYSNDLCNGIALVDKVCFVIATEYIGTFRWGKDGRVDNVFAQNSSYMETVKRIIGGVKIRMRILNMIPVIQITLLIKLIAMVIIYKFTPVILVNKFLNRVIPKPCIGWHYCIPFYFSHNIITSVDISV